MKITRMESRDKEALQALLKSSDPILSVSARGH